MTFPSHRNKCTCTPWPLADLPISISAPAGSQVGSLVRGTSAVDMALERTQFEKAAASALYIVASPLECEVRNAVVNPPSPLESTLLHSPVVRTRTGAFALFDAGIAMTKSIIQFYPFCSTLRKQSV